MPTVSELPLSRSRSGAIVFTVAVHLALLLLWRANQGPQPRDTVPEPTVFIQWFKALPPRPPEPALAAKPLATAPRHVAAAPHTEPIVLVPSAAPVEASVTPTVADKPNEHAPPAPAPRSADDILQQARREVGKIDRDLRTASPNQIHAPADTALTRFAEKMEAATRAPAWYEPAKIEAIADEGGYGRRMYKIKTAFGTYCATYESNHSPDGVDRTNTGTVPKLTNCPRELPIH